MPKSARKRPHSPLFRAGAFTLSAAVVLAGCSSNQPIPAPNLTTSNTTASASGAASAPGSIVSGSAPGSVAAPGSSAAPAKKSIADPALLATYSASGIAMTDSVTPDPTKNFVTTPAGTVTVTQVGRVADVSVASGNVITGTPPDSSKTYVPAEGHHFLVFTVKATPGWPSLDAPAAADTTVPDGTVAFSNGGTTTDITAQVGFVTTRPGANPSTVTGPATFVTSVADGATTSLRVGAAGHNQTMTVDTASRVADPVAAVYYQTNRQVAVNATSPVSTKTWQYTASNGGVDPVTASYGLTASTVMFTAYSPEKGWAPDGEMWVQVAVADQIPVNGSVFKMNYSAWSLTDTTKKVYKTVTNTLPDKPSGIATFLVPVTATSLTASLGTKMTAFSVFDDQMVHPYKLSVSPAVFTATLK